MLTDCEASRGDWIPPVPRQAGDSICRAVWSPGKSTPGRISVLLGKFDLLFRLASLAVPIALATSTVPSRQVFRITSVWLGSFQFSYRYEYQLCGYRVAEVFPWLRRMYSTSRVCVR